MYPFKKLHVWQRAHELAVLLLKDFKPASDPRTRMLSDQIWRAATSISANIAEGSGSPSHAVFARHLGSTVGSAHELENHLTLAVDAALGPSEVLEARIEELTQVRRMLWTLRERVRTDPRGKRQAAGER